MRSFVLNMCSMNNVVVSVFTHLVARECYIALATGFRVLCDSTTRESHPHFIVEESFGRSCGVFTGLNPLHLTGRMPVQSVEMRKLLMIA